MANRPGNKTRLEPNALPEKHAPGRRETATRPWGVLSGIVLGAWESHAHGKDLTEVRSEHKETRAGHVGLEPHEQTSLRGIAIRAKESMKILLDAKASTTEEPDAGKLHVRVCAGGLW